MIKIGDDYYTAGDICCGILMVMGTIVAVAFLACLSVGIIVFTYDVVTGKLVDTSTCEIQEVK